MGNIFVDRANISQIDFFEIDNMLMAGDPLRQKYKIYKTYNRSERKESLASNYKFHLESIRYHVT